MSITPKRIESIDLLRGIVIIIMAIDHVRGYFHAGAHTSDPTDLSTTYPALFFTRWITHFCAPVFVFLAGTSASLIGQRKSKAELSRFLLTRGLWLVFVELVIVNFAWFFDPHFSFNPLQVIWALGISMIALAALIHLPGKLILVFGLAILFGHNLLDNVHVEGNTVKAFVWAMLHDPVRFEFLGRIFRTNYPVLPWIGIMALGYSLGSLYAKEVLPEKRKKILLSIGGAAIVLFILIRATNLYGDQLKWSVQNGPVFTLMSFINTTKYPPSLLYSLMTLGPSLILLALLERPAGKWAHPILHFGRVPMFFYLLHLYLIHILATIALVWSGIDWHETILTKGLRNFNPVGYGFSLPVVFLV
ncbi:MAG TPA: heparan-alpha-glucosaminide N-acetyltransferase domain-containing protein [Chitinophagaceae bacterium]|nr:heparan-alpha-glucosaminide N-acetyltransferase domain-containing protein [Chitinophagaceae bacterium]